MVSEKMNPDNWHLVIYNEKTHTKLKISFWNFVYLMKKALSKVE